MAFPIRGLLFAFLGLVLVFSLTNFWLHNPQGLTVLASDAQGSLPLLNIELHKMTEQMRALLQKHDQDAALIRALRADIRPREHKMHLRTVTRRSPSAPVAAVHPVANCEMVWGDSFIRSLQDSQTQLCVPRQGESGASKLTLHAAPNMIAFGGFLYGENIVLNFNRIRMPDRSTKKEEDEYFKFSPGSVSGNCEVSSEARAKASSMLDKNSFTDFVNSFQSNPDTSTCDIVIAEPTYLIRRHEYANMWHTGVDYYTAYVALRTFNLKATDWNVFFLDLHPAGALDDPWAQMFGPSSRYSLTDLATFHNRRVCFKKVILGPPNYSSRFGAMVGTHEQCIGAPLVAQFRLFALERYGYVADFPTPRQSDLLYTIIVRRPYVAHPRNPAGRVTRKWANEEAILSAAAEAGITLNVADFAKMSFADQLNIVRRSAVLIGIHGAALTHAMFLPPGSVLFEIPAPERGVHFENLAMACNLTYVKVMGDIVGDDDRKVDPEKFVQGLKEAVKVAKRNFAGRSGIPPSRALEAGDNAGRTSGDRPYTNYLSPISLSHNRFGNCRRESSYIVTGGAGFIGSHLVDSLLKESEVTCVIVLDNLSTGQRENLEHHKEQQQARRLHVIEWDIRNPLLPDPDVDGEDEVLQAQYVFHLASPASPVHYQSDPHFTFTTNVLGMQNVLEYADALGARVLFSSTSEVYGDPLVHPQEESYWGNVNSFGPRSCYDEGKRASETLCYIYLNTKQTDVRLARIFNTYGPRMAINDGRVVSTMVLQALQSEPIPMHGSGNQTRSFCFVSDMVAGLIALMRVEPKPSTPVNLGNPNEITIAELCDRVMTAMKAQGRKTESKIDHRPPALDDPQRRKPNIALAGTLLNWSPQIALDAGLAKTIEYFAEELAAGHRPW